MQPTSEGISMPLLDEAAAALRNTGHFESTLSGEELARMMDAVVGGLLAGQRGVKATPPRMSVELGAGTGWASGIARVESPIAATVRVRCVLGNDVDPSRLRLVDLDLKEEASGFAARLALRALNLEQRARSALSDPNRALELTLGPELQSRGARLTALGLHFGERALEIRLRGEPLSADGGPETL